ncbi:hypothetical protein V6N11_028837 [Hibiscus sabdariffa]|uniref:Uncharacterized protein n=1 Tax=Hibiscus sabdariffa TaxID=183260 RepID=A0ABR2PQZ9_9ROSI
MYWYKVNRHTGEDDDAYSRNSVGEWEDLWASEVEPNDNGGFSDNEHEEGLPRENDSEGVWNLLERPALRSASILRDAGLYDVPVVNVAFLGSDTSSFCLKNGKGALISGMGIPISKLESSHCPHGGKEKEWSNAVEEQARGDVAIGKSNSSEESVALGQFADDEAANALDVGNHVGFRFKGDRVEVLRDLAMIEEANSGSK